MNMRNKSRSVSLGKRGSVIAIWIFFIMVIVTCLSAAYFFVKASQNAGQEFPAVSSGFYFHMEKERAEVILKVYGQEAIFKTYSDTISLELSQKEALNDFSGNVFPLLIIYGKDLGNRVAYEDWNGRYIDWFEFNLKNEIIDLNSGVFAGYPDDLNGAALKKAIKNAEVIFDGENISILIPKVEVSYSSSGLEAKYVFDVFYNTSLSKLGLVNLSTVYFVADNCKYKGRFLVSNIREMEDNCVIEYFAKRGFEVYGLNLLKEFLDKTYVAPMNIFSVDGENYRVFSLLSKNKYYFNKEVQKIEINFMWKDS